MRALDERAAGMGRLFVIAAPSGAGKTSIASRLAAEGLVDLSVSHTTRAPRGGEADGGAYFFVSEDEFARMRENGEFLECACVYGHWYGTSRAWVGERLAAGRHVLLEIDCQGAAQIRRLAPAAVLIFIAPPSLAALRERLRRRREDAPEVMARRLAAAEAEMAQRTKFDHVVVNDCLETAAAAAARIVRDAASR